MLSLQEFIAKYQGVPNVGDTPQNIGQCVGLVELWTDNLGLVHTWGNAADLLANADKTAFDVIANSPTNYPLPGDVICWDGTWGGGVGHTGVVVTADAVSFTGFEQNNPEGHAPQLVHHTSYNGVEGWLHPKQAIPVTPAQPTNPDDDARITRDAYYVALRTIGETVSIPIDVANLDAWVQKVHDIFDGRAHTIDTLTEEVTSLNDQISKLKADNEGYLAANKTLNEKLAGMAEVVKKDAVEDSDVHTQLLDVQHQLDETKAEHQKQVNQIQKTYGQIVKLLVNLFVKRKV